MDIGYFLKLMTEKNASDMFLTTGAPVYIKVEGKLYPLGNTGLPAGMVKKIAYSLMDEGQVPAFERDLEYNMAIAVKDTGRFRVNVFKQRGEVGMVIRAIRSVIRSKVDTPHVKRAGAVPMPRARIYPYDEAALEQLGEQLDGGNIAVRRIALGSRPGAARCRTPTNTRSRSWVVMRSGAPGAHTRWRWRSAARRRAPLAQRSPGHRLGRRPCEAT